ncbi:MAG: acyl-CoA dehydrogenase [Gammaproteobacteria bacterium]|nr:acyl-CoA dehydrogenase [Gammaproteobacteria bacterium]MDH5175933.1 acyl-CoA dehydrogenase [Gammaproteobacteria bacterium]MDH5226571.1 acyl-CoA dehydrogenase [Gammaproteobacteria bacterium]
MPDYTAPLQQMRFTIEHLADFRDVAALQAYSSVDLDTVEAVLEEAGRFAGGVLAPINWLGDRKGVQVVDRAVVVPPEFTEAYAKFSAGGWPGIAANPDFGGQGLPKTISIACDEMWSAANVAFALCPELSQGAILALDKHGTEELKAQYLGKLVSGEWTGTMCLTEPQAGSDLSSLTTRAEPQADGSYLLTGRKIYITWGDHAMTPNVVHLVLARTPGAPQGTKGISLFLVPKFKLDAAGNPGERNDAFPVSVEHKMGIHASPTCVMAFGDNGGAQGWLVGTLNEGLAAMFTMMNYMRLGVGAQGVGLADRSYQAAVKYARDRVQGRAPGEKGRVAIIRHPDVRRSLLLMRALTQACRAICFYTASCLDRGNYGDTPESSAAWLARGDLMTPIAKAFSSEIGQDVTSLGIQLHGGMGYVEETGVAQFYRDARIAAIYEGTNAIQAIDLVGRKLMRDGGATVSAFVSDMRAVDAPLANAGEDMASVRVWLAKALDEVVQCSSHLLAGERKDPELLGSAAFNYLMLMGTVIGGWQLARGALAAIQQLERDATDAAFLRTQVLMAQFYAEHVLPRALAYGVAVRAGSRQIMALTADQF